AMFLVGFFGRDSFGYFIKVPIVAYEIRSPPSLPNIDEHSTVSPLALPSKSIKSWYSLSVSCSRYFFPFPFKKNSPIAFSPECPNGGFPISWANDAAATIAPKSLISYPKSFRYGYFSRINLPTLLPNERPTTETSRL